MKILLISDTHGRIDAVNELAAATGADCCFHLGDLCTFTKDSVDRFPAELLYKQLRHAPALPPERLSAVDRDDVAVMRDLAVEYRTYGNFEDYLSGKRRFDIPVYAVPGNNDDAEVIARLEAHPIENLTILNEDRQVVLGGRYLVYGIGGDIAASAPGESAFGAVSTRRQVSVLAKSVAEELKRHPHLRKLQLTHIPPDGDSALRELMTTFAPEWAFGGHIHHWEERGNAGGRIVVLPCVERGYAILTLEEGKEDITMIDREIRTVLEQRHSYSALAEFIETILHKLFDRLAQQIQVRVKSDVGIAEKMLALRKNSAAPPLPADIIGARLIFLRKDRLAAAERIIADNFEVVERQNVQDRLGCREFGYLSHHYTVKCGAEWIDRMAGLAGWPPDISGLPENIVFEIQVRTWLQHVWAELEHDSVYKTFRAIPDRVPLVRREWAMLASMLEKLDDDLVSCLKKTEAVKWPYINRSEARRRLDDLLCVSEALKGAGCGGGDAKLVGEIERLRRLLGECVEEPAEGKSRTPDPLDPENFIRHLVAVPADIRAYRVFAPHLAERCRKMIEASNDLPWAFAGIVLGGLLGGLVCRGTDEEKAERERAVYDAALRLIDLCNARSIANLVGRDLVATERTKAALRSLKAVVCALSRRDDTIRNIAALLELGIYAHRLDEHEASGEKNPVVILAGGCDSLETCTARAALKDFRVLFREALKCGAKKITFHTGYGSSGICSLKGTIARTGKNHPYTVESFPKKRPERHSVADAIGGWQALKRRKYDFDDVALLGFGVPSGGISELECKIALAFGARVTVICHNDLPGMRFADMEYWSSHPSLVELPHIGNGEPRNRSFESRDRAKAFCAWCRDRGFPEPEMVRGFMLFRTFHENDFLRCRTENTEEGRLARIIHWQKQMSTRSPCDLEDVKEEHLNSILHRMFMLDELLKDIEAADLGTLSRRGKFHYGEKEHARWYIERWLQGCRYGKVKTANLNPCMVSWYDLDDEAIQKDITYLERVRKAKTTDYDQCRNDFTKMLRSRKK